MVVNFTAGGTSEACTTSRRLVTPVHAEYYNMLYRGRCPISVNRRTDRFSHSRCWVSRIGRIRKKSPALATVPACPPGRRFCCRGDPVVPGLRTGLHHRLEVRAPSGSSCILDFIQRRPVPAPRHFLSGQRFGALPQAGLCRPFGPEMHQTKWERVNLICKPQNCIDFAMLSPA